MTIKISLYKGALFLRPSTEITAAVCPYCSSETPLASGLSTNEGPPRKPSEGSLSICSNCAGIGVFNSDLSIRTITAEELASFDSEMRSIIAITVEAVKRVRR